MISVAEKDFAVYELALRMGDNALILAQRVGAWCGHAPVLEEDIALANVALDLIGQTQMWLGLAGDLEGIGRSADDLAFLRDGREFRNCLLVEQPNTDFAVTLMRQFLFDAWHHPMLVALKASSDVRVAEIAEKSEKEARYHLERSEDLIVRLGDGSDASHDKMQTALDELFPFAGELCVPDVIDDSLAANHVAPDLNIFSNQYHDYISGILERATLAAPFDMPVRKGGKQGLHSEEHGYILAELQWMQRVYPGLKW